MELMELYTAYLKVRRGYSDATIRAYIRDTKSFAKFILDENGTDLFDKAAVVGVGHRSLRSWTGFLLKSGNTTRTVSRKLASIKSYFECLRQHEVINANPSGRISLPKMSRKLAVFLKEHETEILLETVTYPDTFEGIRDKCILEVLYGCGLRRSELLALSWTDIDFGQQILTIKGKGNKPRIVPFTKPVLRSLEKYKEKCFKKRTNLQGAFFVKTDGTPMYDKLIYRITKKYFMQVSAIANHGPHVLRHTYATHLLNAGAGLNDIKTLLGHSSLAATQIYTHNSLTRLKNAHNLSHPRAKKRDS